MDFKIIARDEFNKEIFDRPHNLVNDVLNACNEFFIQGNTITPNEDKSLKFDTLERLYKAYSISTIPIFLSDLILLHIAKESRSKDIQKILFINKLRVELNTKDGNMDLTINEQNLLQELVRDSESLSDLFKGQILALFN